MLIDFLALGNTTEEQFWALTPRQYFNHMKAARKRLEKEADDLIELAWHTAHFVKIEKLRPLKHYLSKRGPIPKLTAEAATERLRAMARNMPKRTWEEWTAK